MKAQAARLRARKTYFFAMAAALEPVIGRARSGLSPEATAVLAGKGLAELVLLLRRAGLLPLLRPTTEDEAVRLEGAFPGLEVAEWKPPAVLDPAPVVVCRDLLPRSRTRKGAVCLRSVGASATGDLIVMEQVLGTSDELALPGPQPTSALLSRLRSALPEMELVDLREVGPPSASRRRSAVVHLRH